VDRAETITIATKYLERGGRMAIVGLGAVRIIARVNMGMLTDIIQ